MAISLPLRGVRVQLSGSVPDTASPEQAAGILAFVQALAAAIFREGGSVLHGSHPTLIPPLRSTAESLVRAGGRPGALTLVRPHQIAVTDAEMEEIQSQRKYAAVHVIPPSPTDHSQSLLSMLDWMVERCDAIVAVGGRWYEVDKSRAGVPIELEEAMCRGMAAFAFAGLGGALADYLKDNFGV